MMAHPSSDTQTHTPTHIDHLSPVPSLPLSCTALQYKEEVGTLIDELAAAGAAALGVTLDAGVRERLCAYARSGTSGTTRGRRTGRCLAAFFVRRSPCTLVSPAARLPLRPLPVSPHPSHPNLVPAPPPPTVAHFPTAVKEFPWRNGYFYGVSKAAAAGGLPDPCPTHTAWLQEVGAI